MRGATAAAFAIVSIASVARASIPDVFGLGAEESGVGGASAARVHDASAGHYDPAGLTDLPRPTFSIGVVGFGSSLAAGSHPQAIADPFAIELGAAAPLPLGAGLARRVFVGIGIVTLPDQIVHVISRAPDTPFFPYYDNRTQRLVLLPTIALRLGAGFSVGIAANYLAGLAGNIAATEGSTRAVEPRVDEQIVSVLRCNLGVRWRSAGDRLALALVYRQSFSVPFSTVANNVIAGEPIDLKVVAEGLYTPDELVLGGAFRALPWLLVSADAQVSLWSRWAGPYVAVSSVLPIAGPIATAPLHLQFSDAYALRVGAELVRELSPTTSLHLRRGLGVESSMLPSSQPGVTNLIDGPKLFLSVGAGLVVRGKDFLLHIDTNAQLHIVGGATLVKKVDPHETDPTVALRDSNNPGYPTISGGGSVWSAGLTLTVER